MYVITKVVQKGKPPEHYQKECREMRRKKEANAVETLEQDARLSAIGWNDEKEILGVLFSYGKANPYSCDKFYQDFKELMVKRDNLARGIHPTPRGRQGCGPYGRTN